MAAYKLGVIPSRTGLLIVPEKAYLWLDFAALIFCLPEALVFPYGISFYSKTGSCWFVLLIFKNALTISILSHFGPLIVKLFIKDILT